MSDELLNRATRALRSTAAPRRDDLEAELLWLTAQRARLSRTSQRTRSVLLGIAATFVCVGAWANATGKLGSLRQLAQEPFATHTQTAPRKLPRPDRTRPPKPANPATETVLPQEPPLPEAPSAAPRQSAASEERPMRALVPSSPPRGASTSEPPSAATPKAPEAPLPSPKAEQAPPNVDELYRAAHRAHFSGADPAAALAAWDRYLAAAGPGARFLLEGRYNRAITLVKLGRSSEARAALQPFASGEYGGYRRDEARALLESLGSSTP